MKRKNELRGISGIETRELSQDENESGYIGAIKGRIPFDSDSKVMMRKDARGNIIQFVERIARGAFDKSLSEDRDIVATIGHADDPLSAVAVIGKNLFITTDERSMNWEALIPDTRAGKDAMKLVEMGIISGTSFEFIPNKGGERFEKRASDGIIVRTITDARLFEVNPVKMPAYLGTSFTVEMRDNAQDDMPLADDLTEFREAQKDHDDPDPPTENHSIAHRQRALDLIDKTAN